MPMEERGLMSFVGAKNILRSYSNYKAFHNGRPIKVLAREEGVSEGTIRDRLRKIENYISEGQLEYKLNEAKRAVGWVVTPKKTMHEEVPVRCASGCRFTPL